MLYRTAKNVLQEVRIYFTDWVTDVKRIKKSRDVADYLISYLETSSNSGSTHTVMGERGSNKAKLRITVNEEIEKSFSKTCEPWCSSFERLCYLL